MINYLTLSHFISRFCFVGTCQAPKIMASTNDDNTVSGLGGEAESGANSPIIRPRFSFYETEKDVTIDIFIRNMVPDLVRIEFFARRFRFQYTSPHDSSASQMLDLKLHGMIDPEQCSYRVGSVKAEVKLRKLEPGIKWNRLELSPAMVSFHQNYSVANKALLEAQSRSRRFESQIAEIEKEEKENMDGPDALFRQLFEGADDDSKRAMMKSYQESNGTVLSMNWNEVKRGKVEMKTSDDDDD